MEFKGTKGPWVIGSGDPNGILLNAIPIKTNDDFMWDVCAVWNDIQGGQQTAKYNAKLISKAPEMLEMIQTILDNSDVPNEIYDKSKQLIKEATEL